MDKIKAAMKGPDVAATLEETHNLADLLQISGTPSYVIADSVMPGAVGYDALKQQVDAVRHCGGTTSFVLSVGKPRSGTICRHSIRLSKSL